MPWRSLEPVTGESEAAPPAVPTLHSGQDTGRASPLPARPRIGKVRESRSEDRNRSDRASDCPNAIPSDDGRHWNSKHDGSRTSHCRFRGGSRISRHRGDRTAPVNPHRQIPRAGRANFPVSTRDRKGHAIPRNNVPSGVRRARWCYPNDLPKNSRNPGRSTRRQRMTTPTPARARSCKQSAKEKSRCEAMRSYANHRTRAAGNKSHL